MSEGSESYVGCSQRYRGSDSGRNDTISEIGLECSAEYLRELGQERHNSGCFKGMSQN